MSEPDRIAEFKQVTVLFADVVHSMDIAAAVGTERLREVMGSVFDCCGGVVQRYGGAVDKFTGDGIMAVFGAPIALEDHAFRSCLAALEIQREIAQLALGVDLRLRIGLNSGQVIIGPVGSGGAGYTAIGEQVGMAQRMESVAPAGGVMLSESTARLVQHTTILGAPELVHIKGTDTPVPARRLLALNTGAPQQRGHTTLVGRTWEVGTLGGLLDDVTSGTGAIVTIAGPPGIGKTRLTREAASVAADRGVAVFSTYCESHTSDIAFRVVTRLLRATTGVNGVDAATARAGVRAQVPDADPEDVLLLDDLLGIADPTIALPDISADARRRRLTALINTASLARTTPTLYIIEDVHWIDQASETLIADFLTVIPQTPSLVLVTHRPEYGGPLTEISDAQVIRLRPLNTTHSTALATELLGTDPSVTALGALISQRAAGNPFFVEEIVRDLAEQHVLDGQPGAYQRHGDLEDVQVPATLQAAIAARIDRLSAPAKDTLGAAAVIGARFDIQLLAALTPHSALDELVTAQLIDQTRYTPNAEYAFHHPLVQTVAYTTQLKSARADRHRRLAATIEHADDNAALIAEHLEAAGDLADAYTWHMRAGGWARNRDCSAAHTSWSRARQIADALSSALPDQSAMRISPRALISATAWRLGSGADPGFEQLRELCITAGDQRSLATGMAGQVVTLYLNNRRREGSNLATELMALLQQLNDPVLMVGALPAVITARYWAAEISELLRLTDLIIELADGDTSAGDLLVQSPIRGAYALRSTARWCLGVSGWKDDLLTAVSLAHRADPATRGIAIYYLYAGAVANGVLLADSTALRETADALAALERSGDNVALNLARSARATVLARQAGPQRDEAFELFSTLRNEIVNDRHGWMDLPTVDTHTAAEKARTGDLDGAIALARSVLDEQFGEGGSIYCPPAVTVLVQALLDRGAEGDLAEAQTVVDRLATAFPTDPGMALVEVPSLRLRALLARASGDKVGYADLRDRYRKMANDLGFEGHMAWSEAMP